MSFVRNTVLGLTLAVLTGTSALAAVSPHTSGIRLASPESGTALSLPVTFSWTSSNPALKAQLAFATSPSPKAAYVIEAVPASGSMTLTAEDWARVEASLAPQGNVSTFYWAVVDSDENTFVEASAWRTLEVAKKSNASEAPVTENPEVVVEGGEATLLLQNAKGALARAHFSGTTLEETSGAFNLPKGWEAVGYADFNSDKELDMVLEHKSGLVAFWILEGNTVKEGLMPFRLPEGWSVAAVADLNNDKHADLVLEHTEGNVAAWLLEGTTLLEARSLFTLEASFSVAAAGDFNGDKQADLVLVNKEGAVAFSFLSPELEVKEKVAPFALPSGWEVRGAALINSDAKLDLVLQNKEEGTVAFWLMDGTTLSEAVSASGIEAGWKVAAAR